MGVVRIGISGWTYPPWRGPFYPPGLAHRRELEYASRRLRTIEVNGSFYALQKPSSFQQWREQTPEGFVLAVKGGRFITHMKKLRDVETPLANFFASGVLALGDKLGPVLWQLPPNLGFTAERLGSFLDQLPTTAGEAVEVAGRHDARVDERSWLQTDDASRPIHHALEVRHPSWADEEAYRLLRAHDVALVTADTDGRWPHLEVGTAGFRYARLHGHDELYASGYDDAALDVWADKVRNWSAEGDVFVYFDNDAKVRAPFDAMALAGRLGATPEDS